MPISFGLKNQGGYGPGMSWNVLECPGKGKPSWKSPGILANVLECPGKSPLTYT
jgi:hypothetical protein